MTFTPTPEAVEVVGNQMVQILVDGTVTDHVVRRAIAAFVEAEGLEQETTVAPIDRGGDGEPRWRWRGPWRKRD